MHKHSTAHWWFPAVVTAISGVLLAGGTPWLNALKYDRLAIADGESWRLVSGHFAHLGPGHFILNIIALWLIWLLMGSRLRPLAWSVLTVAILAGIDAGFWCLDENLLWYVGLSGLLHGLLIAGAFAGLQSRRNESIVIILAISAKIIYEQAMGPLPGSAQLAGGNVVINSHLYGALSGLLVGWPAWRSARGRASI